MGKDIDLSRYTEEELRALNRRVVERLRLLQQQRCIDDMMEFRTGDSVSFTPERGRIVVGTIVRLNRKSVTVVDRDGGHWRVSPSLLSRTTEATPLGKELKMIEGGMLNKSLGRHKKRK